MERKRSKTTLTFWLFLGGLLSQNLVIPVMGRTLEELADKKNVTAPFKPHTGSPAQKSSGRSQLWDTIGTPPHKRSSGGGSHSHGSPHGSGGDCGSTPSHGSSGKHGSKPSHGSGGSPHGGHGSSGSPHGSAPSHGSGGSYKSPPAYSTPVTTPPSIPTYDPTPNPPSQGGGYHYSPPTGSTPAITPPYTPIYDPTPSTPSQGGGYYHSPPTDPTTPSYDPTPSTPSQGGGHYYSPPTDPTTPPFTPTYDPTPSVPDISTPYTPTTPTIPDPSSDPPLFGTCNYWKDHIGSIWGVFGYFVTVAGIFGAICTPVYGKDVSLEEALWNTRSDGIGSLYREGAASLLNSMVNSNFPLTAEQVKSSFVTALVSDKAAATQAKIFQKANEGSL